MAKVMIRAGHGGGDPGAIGPKGTKESDITKLIADELGSILTANKQTLRVRQARDSATIVREANDWKADLFIDVHCNAFTDPKANGIEVWCSSPGSTREQLAKKVQAELTKATGLTDRGVKFKGFYTLRATTMPAILPEIGFISNPKEEDLLNSKAFRTKAATAIAKGTLDQLGVKMSAPTKVEAKPEVKAEEGMFFTVQAGSFTLKPNAEKRQAELKKAGFDSFLRYEKR